MGGERRGGEEEVRRKEAFLRRVEAQEAHCSRRHKGVQVKVNPLVPDSEISAHIFTRQSLNKNPVM